MTGIEPALSAWEADVLPLNYIRGSCREPIVGAPAPVCASLSYRNTGLLGAPLLTPRSGFGVLAAKLDPRCHEDRRYADASARQRPDVHAANDERYRAATDQMHGVAASVTPNSTARLRFTEAESLVAPSHQDLAVAKKPPGGELPTSTRLPFSTLRLDCSAISSLDLLSPEIFCR
jgi:hypothetical protein